SKTTIIDSFLELLKENKNISFKGFLSHTGHTYSANSVHEIHSRHFETLIKLKKLKQRYIKNYPDLLISIGDTPSCSICENFDGIDEIRPGNFVFYDYMQYKLGVCSMEDIAVKLACPVISKNPSRNEVVIYGGAIHLSKDSVVSSNGKPMYGRISVQKGDMKVLLDELSYVSKLSQEHGILKISQKDFHLFNIGDFIEIIPVHSCLTANLMRKYITTDGEKIGMMDF
ncbi:MAG: alanine racemase, partial [Bacteroidota bacterium]